jgi:hypothetical protein
MDEVRMAFPNSTVIARAALDMLLLLSFAIEDALRVSLVSRINIATAPA